MVLILNTTTNRACGYGPNTNISVSCFIVKNVNLYLGLSVCSSITELLCVAPEESWSSLSYLLDLLIPSLHSTLESIHSNMNLIQHLWPKKLLPQASLREFLAPQSEFFISRQSVLFFPLAFPYWVVKKIFFPQLYSNIPSSYILPPGPE